MARTISEIYTSMLANVASESNLSGLNSTSVTAVHRLFLYIVATGHWVNETLFGEHKTEVNDIIAKMKPHKPKWYAEMAKKFQLGFTLVDDEDFYDNTGVDEQDVLDSQIVAYSAVDEIYKGLRVKIARIDSGDLAPLTAPQLEAFEAYMKRIKDGGVRLYFKNEVADDLKLDMKLYYDALVLDADGKRLDGTSDTPVQDAIDAFLKQDVPFNGLFVLAELVEYLKTISGVVIAHVNEAQAKYGGLSFNVFTVEYKPDAGYLRIADPNTDLTIEFIAHEPI